MSSESIIKENIHLIHLHLLHFPPYSHYILAKSSGLPESFGVDDLSFTRRQSSRHPMDWVFLYSVLQLTNMVDITNADGLQSIKVSGQAGNPRYWDSQTV